MGIDTRDVRIEVLPPANPQVPLTLAVITYDIGQDRGLVNNSVALYDSPQRVMADTLNESQSFREAYAAHEPRVNAARAAASAAGNLPSSSEQNEGTPNPSPISTERDPKTL